MSARGTSKNTKQFICINYNVLFAQPPMLALATIVRRCNGGIDHGLILECTYANHNIGWLLWRSDLISFHND